MDSTGGDLSGSVVGGTYKIDKKIQSGYYGTTWLAHDTRTDGKVCLKTFFRENASQRKELDILKKLSAGNFCHDNLCAILDVCSDRAPVTDWRGDSLGSVQYVVFEYCSGADLFNFLVTGPYERIKNVSGFPEPLARHYFTQALLAVMYLHERGVFHRDIKPENCVLDHNFNLKLTDFGTNKFLPASSSEPGQLLRASTKKVGTDSYRAPEVDSGEEYDPSAADVWSLGVMLFFMVAVEAMVLRARELDPYLKPLLAPLGIFFPFPFQCKLLDSYLKKDSEIAAAMAQFKLTVSQLYPNRLLWDEWLVLKQSFSADLIDFFNCMFVLNPAHRVVLRDLARHSWLSSGTSLTPGDIADQMNNRSPVDIGMNVHASPSVRASKLLGGVDQAILRQSLSCRGGMATSCEYLSDSEVWELSQALRDIEALQVDMANAEDIQNLMLDISFARQVLVELLQRPHSEKSRSVLYSDIPSSWVTQLLGKVGFLPHNRLLYLMQDRLDPALIGHALEIIEGVEFAVSRDVIRISNIDLDDYDDVIEAMEDDVDGNYPAKITGQVTFSSQGSDVGGAMSSSYRNSVTASADSASLPHKLTRRRSSSEPVHSPTHKTPLGSMDAQSSQDSWWTNGASLSTQSSQEELPEAMLDTPSSQELAQCHLVMDLNTTVDRHKPFQFKSAGEFCKMSGLLCSYGYYQVAIGGQLALYCRGNTSSFSARVVILGNTQGSIGISSWCFEGAQEWQSILQRLRNDMQTTSM